MRRACQLGNAAARRRLICEAAGDFNDTGWRDLAEDQARRWTGRYI